MGSHRANGKYPCREATCDKWVTDQSGYTATDPETGEIVTFCSEGCAFTAFGDYIDATFSDIFDAASTEAVPEQMCSECGGPLDGACIVIPFGAVDMSVVFCSNECNDDHDDTEAEKEQAKLETVHE